MVLQPQTHFHSPEWEDCDIWVDRIHSPKFVSKCIKGFCSLCLFLQYIVMAFMFRFAQPQQLFMNIVLGCAKV